MPAVVISQVTNPATPCEVTVMLENEQHELAAHVVKLSYHRSKLSKRFFRDLEAIQNMDDDDEEGIKRELGALFLSLVRWWDVQQQEGGPMVPLTPDAIAPMDAYFIGELLFGIVKHHRRFIPGEAPSEKPNVTPLSGSSPRTGKKIASRRA